MAQVSLAWLRRIPVVVAPLIGALKPKHIDDAVAALAVTLTDEEAVRLEAAYTHRRDGQGVSDPGPLTQSIEAITGFKAERLCRAH